VPLAVQRDLDRPQASVELAAGATVMLFTDGLVERRGESIDAGIARVADVLKRNTKSPVDEVAEVMLRELAPVDGFDDDVAIVVCRPPVATLRIDEPAVPEQLAALRRQLSAWLRAVGVADDLAADVLLAVGEACSNSIEHAYRDRRPGIMRVEAEVELDRIRVRVVDFGSWRTPTATLITRGRGLPLMRAVSDVLDVGSTTEGTTVAMNFHSPSPSVS
jgi:anti-sigma regulatory factor (Ser/Thr protein kinase)